MATARSRAQPRLISLASADDMAAATSASAPACRARLDGGALTGRHRARLGERTAAACITAVQRHVRQTRPGCRASGCSSAAGRGAFSTRRGFGRRRWPVAARSTRSRRRHCAPERRPAPRKPASGCSFAFSTVNFIAGSCPATPAIRMSMALQIPVPHARAWRVRRVALPGPRARGAACLHATVAPAIEGSDAGERAHVVHVAAV